MQEEQEESLWQEIDRAERHLLCGAFEEARTSASEALWRASALCTIESKAPTAIDGVIECSCMVLLQAQHELRRHEELEAQFLKVFSRLDAIPPGVFLTWSCLRVKAGDKDGAEAAVSKYLESRGRQLDRRASCSLAALYALDILSDYCKDPQRAEDWLNGQSGWLDVATTKLLLKKVKRRQRRLRPSSVHSKQAPGKDSSPPSKSIAPPKESPPERSPVPTTLPSSVAPSILSDTASIPPAEQIGRREATGPRPNFESSSSSDPCLTSLNPGLRKGWASWLLYWATLVQNWWRRGWQRGRQTWQRAAEDGVGRTVLMVLAAGVFAYALMKERAALRRHLRKLGQSCQQNVADLYGLAFSYSLNPLAAAAQLSPPAIQRS